MSARPIRNIAIIAHVDHGKTTLVDKMLRPVRHVRRDNQQVVAERVMDSNDLEKERGITILAKATLRSNGKACASTSLIRRAMRTSVAKSNVFSTWSTAWLLLVDAAEGPMPQTRFVTKKALAQGLRPIVLVNKVDRDGADPDNAVNLTFDLFDKLGATDEQLDFPIVYASGLNGWAAMELDQPRENMKPLFDTILRHVPAPDADVDAPLQLQVFGTGLLFLRRSHRRR